MRTKPLSFARTAVYTMPALLFLNIIFAVSCRPGPHKIYGYPGSPVSLETGAENSYYPDMTYNGDKIGLTWQDSRTGDMQVYAGYYSTEGSLQENLYSTLAAGDSQDPAITWSGETFYICWSDSASGSYQLYLAELEGRAWTAAIQLTTEGIAAENPSLAEAAGRHGIAWEDVRDGNKEIYFKALEHGAAEAGDIRITKADGSSLRPFLAWTGSEFGLVWHDNRNGISQIYFARLESIGTKMGRDVQITDAEGAAENPCLVWNGSEYGLVWEDGRFGEREIMFQRLKTDGSPAADAVRLTNSEGHSGFPDMVLIGEDYVLAWQDDSDGDAEIYTVYIDSGGRPYGNANRVTDNADQSTWPSIVWTGSSAVIVWVEDGGELYMAY